MAKVWADRLREPRDGVSPGRGSPRLRELEKAATFYRSGWIGDSTCSPADCASPVPDFGRPVLYDGCGQVPSPARPGSPRSNRSPKPAEVSACSGYLVREIDMLHPSVIVTFGKVAAEGVVHTLTLRASSELLPEVIAFPHPSPRNLRTILRLYPSMRAFEGALTLVFRRLIKRLGRRSTHA